MDDAKHQEGFVALRFGRAGKSTRHPLAGAVAVVHGAAREATLDETVVDGAAALHREMATAGAGGLVECKVLGSFERRRDTADRGAAPAIGNEIGTAHDTLPRAARGGARNGKSQPLGWRQKRKRQPKGAG